MAARPPRASSLILSLGILNALTPFSVDLYLPAFQRIATDLGTTVPRVALTLSGYFIGFAIGQILYGPLLDRFGRKPPILAGLGIYLLATLGCLTCHSVEALLFFRFLSALGGSAAGVGAMTLVRDLFPPEEGAKVFSMLMLVLSASPLLAPSIGSFIVGVASWRVIFACLTALALIDVALVLFAIPMPYRPDPGVHLRLIPIFRTFREIFRNRAFRAYTIAGSLSFAGLFVYLAGSPSIFMDGFRVSPNVYSAIFAGLAVAMIGGGQINHLLLRRWSSATIFLGSVIAQLVSGAVFLVALLTVGLGLVPTIFFLFVLLLSAGIGYPNAASLALEPFSRNVGSASSLLGFLQMGLGAVLSAWVGILDAKGTLPTAGVMTFASLLGLVVLLLSGLDKKDP